MVDLQNLKSAITDGGFSEEAKALMLPIIEAAIARGSITTVEKKKLQDIMDVEFDRNELEKNANQDASEMIESFLAESDAASQSASDDMEALEQEENDEISDLKSESSAPQAPQGQAMTTNTDQQPVVDQAQPEPAQSAFQPTEPAVQPPTEASQPTTETPQPWQPPTQ